MHRNPSWFYSLTSEESSLVLEVGGSSLGRGLNTHFGFCEVIAKILGGSVTWFELLAVEETLVFYR